MGAENELKVDKRRLIKWAWVSIAAFVIISLIGQILKITSGQDRFLYEFLNVDGEANVPAAFSSLLLLTCSLFSFLCSRATTISRERAGWYLLSLLFFMFSSDELLRFHEQLNEPLRILWNTCGWFHFAWVIPGVIFAFIVLFALVFFRMFPPEIRKRFLLGFLVYFAGAVGMEIVDGRIVTTFGDHSLVYVLGVHIEESLELVGTVLLLNTLLFCLQTEVKKLLIDFTRDSTSV